MGPVGHWVIGRGGSRGAVPVQDKAGSLPAPAGTAKVPALWREAVLPHFAHVHTAVLALSKAGTPHLCCVQGIHHARQLAAHHLPAPSDGGPASTDERTAERTAEQVRSDRRHGARLLRCTVVPLLGGPRWQSGNRQV